MNRYSTVTAILLVTLVIEVTLIYSDFSNIKTGPAPMLQAILSPTEPLVKPPPLVAMTVPAPVTQTVNPPVPTTALVPAPKPKPKPKILNCPLVLPVRAWLAVYVSPSGQRQILTQKQADTAFPVASLSKLMTAIVAKEEVKPDTTLTLSADLQVLGGDQESLATSTSQTVTAEGLLFPLLIESNNNAATALASVLSPGEFVAKMNEKASELGLTQTRFSNPHGLDPVDGSQANQSSATDLVHLAEIYYNDYPSLLGITKQEQFALWSLDGTIVRRFTNTNRFLKSNEWPMEVLGGKTGYTLLADRNLLLVMRDKPSGGLLYTVILGSNNHFAAMTDLLDWIYYNYKF